MAGTCCPTCKRRLPTPKAPKLSPQLAAFLKWKPADTSRFLKPPDGFMRVEHEMPLEARAQFAYGVTGGRRAPDKAVFAAVMYAAPVDLAA